MAYAYIEEFAELAKDSEGNVISAGEQEPETRQRITFSTSAQSAGFQKTTKFVRIIVDTKAHYRFGVNPTAVATDPYLPADAAEYFGVGEFVSGGTLEVAFYDGTS